MDLASFDAARSLAGSRGVKREKAIGQRVVRISNVYAEEAFQIHKKSTAEKKELQGKNNKHKPTKPTLVEIVRENK